MVCSYKKFYTLSYQMLIYYAPFSFHRYGLDSIPDDWLAKYKFSDEVIGYISTVVKAN